jgi:hypothetical protein
MEECTKCKKLKLPSEFNFKIKKLRLRHKQCRICTRIIIKNHYNNNRKYYLQKALKRNNKIKLEVVNYISQYLLNHPCVDCGETDLRVLEFDHTGKIPKFKAVSSMVQHGFPLDKIKEEIDKCEIRCANCHRRKTAKDFRWLKGKKPL